MHDLLFRSFFFFNDTTTTEIYTLSLHDALPISTPPGRHHRPRARARARRHRHHRHRHRPATPASCRRDRKSTRLNSSHVEISYAVFCLKKKTKYTANPLHSFHTSYSLTTSPASH